MKRLTITLLVIMVSVVSCTINREKDRVTDNAGRGQVFVLQDPSKENGYEAILSVRPMVYAIKKGPGEWFVKVCR